MFVSQKCQYALRAVFELAKQYGKGPTKILHIAELQAIPVRFLEVILVQLKRGGFVDSQRGKEGGYSLIRSPEGLTVGEILRFIEGPIDPVDCMLPGKKAKAMCSLRGECVFVSLWESVRDAVSSVYDNTTFRDLVDQEERKAKHHVPSYTI